MSNTDVSWCWDLVVFRLCNQNPTLSQRQILTSTRFSFSTKIQRLSDVMSNVNLMLHRRLVPAGYIEIMKISVPPKTGCYNHFIVFHRSCESWKCLQSTECEMFYKWNRITADYRYQLRKIRSGNVSSPPPLSHVCPNRTPGSERIVVSLSDSQILVSPSQDD